MYNEEKRIQGTLDAVLAWLHEQPLSWELLMVNDGSTDRTAEIVETAMRNHPQITMINNPHSGKSYTLRTGILNARGEYVLHADADLSTPPDEFEKLLSPLHDGYDVAIGSRAGRTNAPWYRQLMSVGFPLLVRLLVVRGLHDTQCGFKAYRAQAAQDLFRRARLYAEPSESLKQPRVTAGSDVEILFLARQLGYKIKEVPVTWIYAGHTKVNPLQDSLLAVMDMLRIRWYGLTGVYNQTKAV